MYLKNPRKLEKLTSNTAPFPGILLFILHLSFPHQLHTTTSIKKALRLETVNLLWSSKGHVLQDTEIILATGTFRPWLFLSQGGSLLTELTRSCLSWLTVNDFPWNLMQPTPDIKIKNKNKSWVRCYLDLSGFCWFQTRKCEICIFPLNLWR